MTKLPSPHGLLHPPARHLTASRRGRQLKLPGRIAASIHAHRVLLAAIQGRDPQRAERAMHDHLMAQLAALKALQRTETRRLQA